MIDYSYETFFGTLANENRLLIIQYLNKNGPQNVTNISNGTKIEQSSVSHSLNRLLVCRFVHIMANGKERIYSLNDETIKPLLKLIDNHIEKYCNQNCNTCVGCPPKDEKNTSKAKERS